METWQETATSDASKEKATPVVITAVNIPYWNLVRYLFMLVFASIPVCVVGAVVAFIIALIAHDAQ